MITGSIVKAEDVWKAAQAKKKIIWLEMRVEFVEYNNKRFSEICEKHMRTIARLKKKGHTI